MEIWGKKPEQILALGNAARRSLRRASADDLCSLLRYDISMGCVHYLFEHVGRGGPAPSDVRPDLTAILRADRQVWLLLIESHASPSSQKQMVQILWASSLAAVEPRGCFSLVAAAKWAEEAEGEGKGGNSK